MIDPISLIVIGGLAWGAHKVATRKPKATPLSAAVLQVSRQPSTASLQPALKWSQDSEAILSGATPK
jgi:hypothetical protein